MYVHEGVSSSVCSVEPFINKSQPVGAACLRVCVSVSVFVLPSVNTYIQRSVVQPIFKVSKNSSVAPVLNNNHVLYALRQCWVKLNAIVS